MTSFKLPREVHDAKLVSITPNAEEQIVYMARVSNPSNQANMETAPRLIVPDQTQALVTIRDGQHAGGDQHHTGNRGSSAAAPQLRSGFSQRYSSVDQLGTVGLPHLRSQDLKNKQASHDDLDPAAVDLMEKQITQIYANAFDYYEYLLSQGWPRSVLVRPTFGHANPHVHVGQHSLWIHFIQIRAASRPSWSTA